MGNVKIKFSINTSSGKVSFSALEELKDIELKKNLCSKLSSWEKRVKEAAAQSVLIKEIGQEQANNYKVQVSSET